jgi:hypothetical protein
MRIGDVIDADDVEIATKGALLLLLAVAVVVALAAGLGLAVSAFRMAGGGCM